MSACLFALCCSAFAFKPVRFVKLRDNSSLMVLFEDGTDRVLRISPPLEPGEKRKVSFSQGFLPRVDYTVEVTGEAEGLAKFVISEFIAKGNGGHDKLELFATSGGRTDGITVFTPDGELTLSPSFVSSGEYLACDLKLANSKGYIEVRSSANRATSRILDKVLYFSRKGDVAAIGEGWQGEPVDISSSTATRSVNRRLSAKEGYVDTDTKNDFYITVTHGATIGRKNDLREYN